MQNFITVCWALNEYLEINKQFWKRLIMENENATWVIIDGSQKGTDILFELFQCFEKTDSMMIFNTTQENIKAKNILEEINFEKELLNKRECLAINESPQKKFDIYYERFANPRKLIAIPKN